MSTIVYVTDIDQGWWFQFPDNPLSPVSDLWFSFQADQLDELEAEADFLGQPFSALAAEILRLDAVIEVTLDTEAKAHRLGVDYRGGDSARHKLERSLGCVLARHFPDPKLVGDAAEIRLMALIDDY